MRWEASSVNAAARLTDSAADEPKPLAMGMCDSRSMRRLADLRRGWSEGGWWDIRVSRTWLNTWLLGSSTACHCPCHLTLEGPACSKARQV